MLAGIIIGSLGVLDDVTVTQVSAVWQLHRANPAYGPRHLYRAAVGIGRDHIASTVNTLVLAYAGASLPLLLIFTQAGRSLGDVAVGELVAVEIVRTLVGSIGLVAAVPLTTGLAALVVARGSELGSAGRLSRSVSTPALADATTSAASDDEVDEVDEPEEGWDRFAPRDPDLVTRRPSPAADAPTTRRLAPPTRPPLSRTSALVEHCMHMRRPYHQCARARRASRGAGASRRPSPR